MQIKGKVHYVGVNDRVKHRFEGLWFLPQGVSYNSYLINDDKAVALVDTVDVAFFGEYIDKIRAVLGDRPIDYLIINHMEPDHSGSISLIRKYYPGIRLIGNAKTMGMVQGYYGATSETDITVKEGSTLDLGHHKLRFHLTPMLHWPETMMTYDETEHILFSGDASVASVRSMATWSTRRWTLPTTGPKWNATTPPSSASSAHRCRRG